MNKTRLFWVSGSFILIVFGAFISKINAKRATINTLYYRSIISCVPITSIGSLAFVTGTSYGLQAWITMDGGGSVPLYATSTCSSSGVVYFNP